jgi:hypothetical protein
MHLTRLLEDLAVLSDHLASVMHEAVASSSW